MIANIIKISFPTADYDKKMRIGRDFVTFYCASAVLTLLSSHFCYNDSEVYPQKRLDPASGIQPAL